MHALNITPKLKYSRLGDCWHFYMISVNFKSNCNKQSFFFQIHALYMVTLRDIIKSLTASVRSATPESEGQSTCDIIELYLDEQTSANIGMDSSISIDSASLDKFSQEILTLYETTITQPLASIVSCKPEVLRIHAQHYILLCSLRALLPLLKPSKIFEEWWDLITPILTTASYTNRIKREARLIVSDALIMEQQLGDLEECVYFNKMVNLYLDWAEQQQTKGGQGVGAVGDETIRQHQALLDLEQDEWSKNLTTILLSVGASETKVKVVEKIKRGDF